jgi:transcriptional regulator with XRE-family HTH domain
LTQAQFAEMAGLRQSQISELESGKMTAQTRRLVTLLKLLGVKIILLKETQ